MEKVYLLLRNNQQTGPYTIEEMLQQQLLPTDLVWVEGKSTAWTHPSEIDWNQLPIAPDVANSITVSKESHETALSSAQSVSTSTPWHLTRRSPQAELEARALELRNNAQEAANTQRHYRTSSSPSTTKRRHTIYETEENTVLLEVHTLGKKSVTLPQLIGAAVLTALLAAGWYNRESLTVIRPSQNILSTAATPVVFEVTPPPIETLQASIMDTSSPVVTATVATATPAFAKKAQAKIKVETESLPENPAPVIAATTAPSTNVDPEPKEAVQTTVVTTATIEKKEAVPSMKGNEPSTAIDAEGSGTKKKTLGQAIKNIFKKKKKEDAELTSSEPVQ